MLLSFPRNEALARPKQRPLAAESPRTIYADDAPFANPYFTPNRPGKEAGTTRDSRPPNPICQSIAWESPRHGGGALF